MIRDEAEIHAELEAARRELHRLRDTIDKHRAEGRRVELELDGGVVAQQPPIPSSVLGRLAILRLEVLRSDKAELPAPARQERILARRAELLRSALDGLRFEAWSLTGPLEAAEHRLARLELELNRDYPEPVNMAAAEVGGSRA
jgi:hypothetical protein